MQTITIEAKYVNDPKPGKKNYTIKTPDDSLYSVPPDFGKTMRPGGHYIIQYEDASFNGKTFHMVKHVEPAAVQQAGNGMAADVNYTKDEVIFVEGMLNRVVGSGLVPLDVDAMTELVNKFRQVWHRTFANPQVRPDLDDEIPYP